MHSPQYLTKMPKGEQIIAMISAGEEIYVASGSAVYILNKENLPVLGGRFPWIDLLLAVELGIFIALILWRMFCV